MRPTNEETCLNVAVEWSKRSTCLRRAVGCVLVNARGHVLATGYNGTAAGLPHCNEPSGRITLHEMGKVGPTTIPSNFPNACPGYTSTSGTNLDGCEAIHAEQNALLQCRDVFAIDVCYVTHSPCVTCVKLLMNTSCRRIVFKQRYAHDDASRLLWERRNDRLWEHYK